MVSFKIYTCYAWRQRHFESQQPEAKEYDTQMIWGGQGYEPNVMINAAPATMMMAPTSRRGMFFS